MTDCHAAYITASDDELALSKPAAAFSATDRLPPSAAPVATVAESNRIDSELAQLVNPKLVATLIIVLSVS